MYIFYIYDIYISQYEILKEQKRIEINEQCYPVHQLILPSTNLYCHFHILFMYHTLFSHAYFHTILLMFPFLINR